jgi:hypothetical protein
MDETKGRFLLITYQTERTISFAVFPVIIISYLVGILYSNLDTLLVLFPSGEGDYSFQLLEGLIIVFVAAGSGFLIAFALKKHLIKVLKSFFAISFFVSSVCMFWIHGYLFEVTFLENVFWVEIITAVIGGIVGCLAIVTFIMGKGGTEAKNATIFILGIVMGTIFGMVFSFVTFITLIILISLFDIYSVFRGPINQIFKRTNFSISTETQPKTKQSIAVGIGDFIFYSSLVTFITKELNPILGFISIVGILVGIKITENMLYRYGKFPGLPLPIFLSLFLVLTGWLLLTYLL